VALESAALISAFSNAAQRACRSPAGNTRNIIPSYVNCPGCRGRIERGADEEHSFTRCSRILGGSRGVIYMQGEPSGTNTRHSEIPCKAVWARWRPRRPRDAVLPAELDQCDRFLQVRYGRGHGGRRFCVMAGSPLLQFEHHRRGYAKHYLEDAFDMAVGLSSWKSRALGNSTLTTGVIRSASASSRRTKC